MSNKLVQRKICFFFFYGLLFFCNYSVTYGDNREGYRYFYDGQELNLIFKEERSIHLSLPADSYIIRLRSKGSVDVYISPKDLNLLEGNIFVRECDAAVITTNTDKKVTNTLVCLSGHMITKEVDSYKINSQNQRKIPNEILKNKSEKKLGKKKINKYYLDTIAEQLIEVRGVNNSLKQQIKAFANNKKPTQSVVCGYYNIEIDCPYIEVHWIGRNEDFKDILKEKKMLKTGPWGLW